MCNANKIKAPVGAGLTQTGAYSALILFRILFILAQLVTITSRTHGEGPVSVRGKSLREVVL